MTLEITFRDFARSDAIESYVTKRAEKLLAKSPRVLTLRVVLAAPHRHQRDGHAYQVRLELHLAGRELVVAPRDGIGEYIDLRAAIDDAFSTAARLLRDYAEEGRETA